jgi:chromate transporter
MKTFRIFLIFLRLGLTSFGGPVAHIGYFRREFVEKRHWLGDIAFADLLALCQFLPGPSSSQLGISIGLQRGGVLGALAAWVGFTLPSALIMGWYGVTLARHPAWFVGNWGHGLKLLACAVVADAVWQMGRQLAYDRPRKALVAIGLAMALLLPAGVGQLGAIALAALIGQMLPMGPETGRTNTPSAQVPIWIAVLALLLLAAGLVGLPLLAEIEGTQKLALFDRLFRTGSLVFGGGHVVLPLLRAALVSPGWITDEQFVSGYALAQALPGPLFTFAAYAGGMVTGGWSSALICTIGIFLPSFLMLFAVMPFWQRLSRFRPMRRALAGVNAAVVGLLLAALYDPVFTTSVRSSMDFVVAALLFLLLTAGRVPVAVLVGLSALVGFVI